MPKSKFIYILSLLALFAASGVRLSAGDEGPPLDIRSFGDDGLVDYGEQDLNLWELFGPPTEHDYIVIDRDTIRFDFKTALRGQPLTEKDYEDVARELGVDVASIKAVVEIETGKTHRGFNPDATPVINFDLTVFRSMATRRRIPLRNYSKTHSVVFQRPDIRRFGTQQRSQHARLAAAMDIDSVAAIEGTFWGMFQIGGFNWKRCGASSPYEFAEMMGRTERDQLELFASFLKSSGLLRHLQQKNWAAFARGYNGPSYAKNGYHTRLAKAYNKYIVNER